jgi:hypothetical protein
MHRRNAGRVGLQMERADVGVRATARVRGHAVAEAAGAIRPETSIAGRFAGSGTAFVNASVVEDPKATIRTAARFGVESGRPGPQAA